MYKQQLINKNRPRTKLNPIGIVLHDTGNAGATAQNHYDYWNRVECKASAHAVVDWNDVIQLIPFDEAAWHAGKTANSKFIGVELCRPKTYDTDKFQRVWENAVDVISDIFIQQLNITKVTNENLMSHAEVSTKWKETDHMDPVSHFKTYGKTVDDFRTDVQKSINIKIHKEDEVKMFEDVRKDDYAYNHIKKLKDYGIINGDENGNFNPDETITRRDAAIMIANALTIVGK